MKNIVNVPMGIGTDIIEIERIKKAAENTGNKFIDRIFTTAEMQFCMRKKNPWPSLAARFSAKEAVFKALGTGVTRWQDIEVTGGGSGPVGVSLSGRAKNIASSRGIDSILLTISHDQERAVAFAVAIGGGCNHIETGDRQ